MCDTGVLASLGGGSAELGSFRGTAEPCSGRPGLVAACGPEPFPRRPQWC